ncbi:coiled-coil domain-containing protein 39 isoform 2-T2 [Anableps anableps]
MDMIEKHLLKANQNLEELRLQMDWDQQTMDDFLEESAQKDDDIMAIIKYAQMDEQKIRSLTLAIEKMTLEVKEKRKALDKELTETKSAQLGLDKTVDDIQQACLEIQQLFHLHENSIKQKKQLDSDRQRCAQQLAQGKQQIREQNTNITKMKHELESRRNINTKLQRNIATTKMQKAMLQQDLKKQEENLARMQVELDSYKSTLNKNRSDMRSLTSQIARMKKDIEGNNIKLIESRAYNAALEEKLRNVTQSALSEEERAAQMEQMLQETEQAIKKLEIEHRDLMEELFRQKQHFQLVKTKEKNVIAHVSNNKITITNLLNQLTKTEKELIRQQMIINSQESKLLMLQRKLAQLQGVSHSNESYMLERKVTDLVKDLEEKKQTAKILSTALAECEVEIRCSRKNMEKLEAQKKDLTDMIDCLLPLCIYKEKELKKLKLKKQDAMVDHNLLKVEVKRVRDLVYSEADSVLSWEVRKLELEKAMKEREEEIHVYSEMLRQQLKITEQDRQSLSIELSEQLSKIDTMKSRFEVLEDSLAGFEGEKSQVYYITKTALEKEELQRKGDELDVQIRKMELETKALENTIQLFTDRSSLFSSGLRRVKKSNPEYQENKKLEEQLKATEEMLKFKKRQVHGLRQDIQFTNLTKEIRSGKHPKTETVEEQDIKLKELKEFIKTINKMLTKAIEDEPELRPALEKYFQQASLPLPSPNSSFSSQQTPKMSSADSSMSFRSSVSPDASSPSGFLLPSAHVKTVNLDLELSNACLPLTPKYLSSESSDGSSNSSRKTKKL